MSNSISGRATAGALMTLSGTASATTYANPQGNYTFTGLGAGAYTITPYVNGLIFSPASVNETIVATDITGVNFLVTSALQGSNVTLQHEFDKVVTMADIEPIFNVAGFTTEPFINVANTVFAAICAVPFPHKWNETKLPSFYTNSWQQDYALVNPDFSSVYNVEWIQRGTAIGINTNTGGQKPWARIECGRSLSANTGLNSGTNTFMGDPGFVVCSYPNAELYYGVWGQPDVASATWGNNPKAGSFYTNPLGNYSQPANPITQIIDANGNLLVLTGYGVEANTAPVLAAGSAPGTQYTGAGQAYTLSSVAVSGGNATYYGTFTGAITGSFVGTTFTITGFSTGGNNVTLTVTASTPTSITGVATTQANETHAGTATGGATTWTVVDPVGLGIRIVSVPSQTGMEWQLNIIGQMPPTRFTNMQQTIAPLPDKYAPYFRAGLIAQLYRHSPIKTTRDKFKEEWAMWLKSLQELKQLEDRELEEFQFVPDRTIMGSGRRRNTYQGGAWPYNYPRP